jgi:hypothetical protein
VRRAPTRPGFDGARLADDLAALLHGGGAYPRLSDAGLVKLFRLLRLARRLLDLETGAASSNPATAPEQRPSCRHRIRSTRPSSPRRCTTCAMGNCGAARRWASARRSWMRSSTPNS